MTDRLMDVPLFVWRMQTLEGPKVPDGQKHSFYLFFLERGEKKRPENYMYIYEQSYTGLRSIQIRYSCKKRQYHNVKFFYLSKSCIQNHT